MQRTNSREADAVTTVLEELAQTHLGVPTLATRNADSFDFHELPVWKLHAALEAAYRAGVETGSRKVSA